MDIETVIREHVRPLPQDHEEGVGRLESLRAKRSALLPMERLAAEKLDALIEEAEADYSPLSGKGYQILSTIPLTWRTESGLPKLALLSPWQPVILIREWDAYPPLPSVLLTLYDDVMARNRARHRTITGKFAGVLPAEIRERIAVEKDQWDAIYVLGETTWTEEEIPVKRDPILVGWDGKNLRVIATFDLTSLEEYVAAEFATKE